MTSFIDNGATLTVEAQGSMSIPVARLEYGGSGEVEAPLVPGGLGRPGEIPAEARGRVVVVDRGEITFQTKTDAAVAAGAAAVVIVNNVPGSLQGTLQHPAAIPVLCASEEEGDRLHRPVARGAVAQLSVRTEIRQSSSQNVVGVAGRLGAPIIILGRHYDSVAVAPGANDNASGTTVVLEVAHQLAHDQRAEVRFVAFGAEEIGLVGRAFYASP